MSESAELAATTATRAGANVPAEPRHECRNCGAQTTGHYCANCGQETRIALPTFGTFMREAAGRYVAMDGRMWRTLAGLIARPGYLTLEYLRGRRRRYIRPARLFLVLYLLLFAVIGLVQSPGGLGDEVVFVNSEEEAAALKAREEAIDAAKEAVESGKEALRAGTQAIVPQRDIAKPAAKAKEKSAEVDEDMRGTFFATDDERTRIGLDRNMDITLRIGGADVIMPAALKRRFDHFKKLSKEEKTEQLYAGMLRFGPYAMVALLPAFAFLLKIAYLGSARRYPGRPTRYAEHLVYSAHLHAFAALMLLAILLIPITPIRVLLCLWIVFYVMRARQVVYRGRWWGGVLRALAIATAYSVLLAFAVVGLLGVAVMLR